MPVTIPVSEPMIATDALDVLHVPPAVASVKVIVPLTLTVAGPEMGAGAGVTVTIRVLRQPSI